MYREVYNPHLWPDKRTIVEQFVQKNPNIQSGVPAFRGTRVSVKAPSTMWNLSKTLEQYLIDFLAANRANATATLELAQAMLDATA